MRTRRGALLGELHAHTMWSDGALTLRELVDLAGVRGFDVLCVTDHVVRRDDPWLDETQRLERGVPPDRYDEYLAAIESEAERAKERYDLLVVPGLELTYNHTDPGKAAHAVAVGLREHVPLDDGIDDAIRSAVRLGAAIVAAHPYPREPAEPHSRLTQRWALDATLRKLAHRFELFNRYQLFGWVADEGLACVATGDVHAAAHLSGWKTLLPCDKDETAVVEYLRSHRPAYLVRVDAHRERVAA